MIIFKDICRFTREAEVGYMKYMELLNKGVELIFIDNQTVSTPYIKQLLNVAKAQNLVARTSLESTVKLLLIVELDRAEQERKITVTPSQTGPSNPLCAIRGLPLIPHSFLQSDAVFSSAPEILHWIQIPVGLCFSHLPV